MTTRANNLKKVFRWQEKAAAHSQLQFHYNLIIFNYECNYINMLNQRKQEIPIPIMATTQILHFAPNVFSTGKVRQNKVGEVVEWISFSKRISCR